MLSNNAKELSRVDLNLLVILEVLLKERNVSRAADILFVSQSAMSRSLKRLRDTFNDPLFTRTATGLVPTPKALELEQQLVEVMPYLKSIFSDEKFIPQQCELTFSISIPTFLSSIIIPPLLKRLSTSAPKVNLIEMPVKSNPFNAIDQGIIDFVIHYSQTHDNKYDSLKIASIYPELFVRTHHPLTEVSAPTLDDIIDYPFIGMLVEQDQYQSFNAPINKVYQDAMCSKKTKLQSTQTQILLDVLADSDAILFGTNTLKGLDGYERDFQRIYSLQQSDQYHIPLHLVQHQRIKNSEPHKWFSQLLMDELMMILEGKSC